MTLLRYLSTLLVTLTTVEASAAEPGDVVQTDNLGMSMVAWNLSKGTRKTVGDEQVLTEFVGAHAYAWRDVRLGMNLQFSEQLGPEPRTGGRLRTFALLPQVGWNVAGPVFLAAVFTVAPHTSGARDLVLGVQAVGGVAFEVARGVKLAVALEVPYNFYPDQTMGLTPLAGAAFRL